MLTSFETRTGKTLSLEQIEGTLNRLQEHPAEIKPGILEYLLSQIETLYIQILSELKGIKEEELALRKYRDRNNFVYFDSDPLTTAETQELEKIREELLYSPTIWAFLYALINRRTDEVTAPAELLAIKSEFNKIAFFDSDLSNWYIKLKQFKQVLFFLLKYHYLSTDSALRYFNMVLIDELDWKTGIDIERSRLEGVRDTIEETKQRIIGLLI